MARKEKPELGNSRVRRDWGWAPEYAETMWRSAKTKAVFRDRHAREPYTGKFVQLTLSELGLDWRGHVKVTDLLMRPTGILEAVATQIWQSALSTGDPRMKMRDVISEMIRAELDLARSRARL